MRRLVSTALLATLLLGAAACTQAEDTPTAATTSNPPASPSTKALDKASSCTAIMTDLTTMRVKGIEAMGTALKAITDPSQEAKAVTDIKAMFADMQTLADKHLPAAGDPEIKAALTEFQTQAKARVAAVEAAGQDVDKAMDALDDPAFEAAGDKLDQLCA